MCPTASPRAEPPRLPHVYRPLAARVVAVAASVSLVAVAAVAWIALPGTVRADFDWFQRATLVVVFGAVVAILWGLARCKVVADVDTITVTNVFRTRTYAWPQVVAVGLHGSSPWAVIDLSDGTSRNVLALQAVDGERASRSARELAAVAASRTPNEDNDAER